MIGLWKEMKTLWIRRWPLKLDGTKGHVAAVVYKKGGLSDSVPGWQTFNEEWPNNRRAFGFEIGQVGCDAADAELRTVTEVPPSQLTLRLK